MFVNEELERLELRRRALIAQSEVQRAMLQLECVRLQPYLDHVDTGVDVLKKAHPFWLLAAPALGALFATQWRRVATWIPTGIVAWRTIRKLWTVWKGHKERTAEGASTNSATTEQA